MRQGCRAIVVTPIVTFRSCGEAGTTEGHRHRDAFTLQIRSKLPRALLQDNTFHRKRQRIGLTALRKDKYSELAVVV